MTPEQSTLWVALAVNDGWTQSPVTVGSSRTIMKDGFCATFIPTLDGAGNRGFCHLAVYGPDGLQVLVPEVYNWEELQARLQTCMYCFAEKVKTYRIAFAGRCCEKCLPELRDRFEYPGWAD